MLRDSVSVYLALGTSLKSKGYLDFNLFVMADTSYGRCLYIAYARRGSLTLKLVVALTKWLRNTLTPMLLCIMDMRVLVRTCLIIIGYFLMLQ